MLTPDLIAAVNATAAAIAEAGAIPTRISLRLDSPADYHVGANVPGLDGHLAVYVTPDQPTRVVVWPTTSGECRDVATIADAVRVLRDVSPVYVDGAPF